MKTGLNVLLLIVFLVIGVKSPTGLTYAMGIAVYLFRNPLKQLFLRIPQSIGFIGSGIVFGLLTECFAILDNLKRLPQDRILIDANPFRDLCFGFFYYGLFIVVWYYLLRRSRFSVWQVFLISGLFGILTEQFNPAAGGPTILLSAIFNPLFGIPVAILIACVYGIFPASAYLLTENRFGMERGRATWRAAGIALGILLIQWAIYGNLLLPLLKKILV